MLPENAKAITFDAGGTLFSPSPSVGEIYREVMERHGLTYSGSDLNRGFKHAFRVVSKDWSISNGEEREWKFWRQVVETSIDGLQPQPADFDTLFADLWKEFALGNRWTPAEFSQELLLDLKERGFVVALLTNWDSRIHSVLRESEFNQFFARVFVSSEIGFDKPDERIFRHVERQLSLTPSEIVHIGDCLDNDVSGARAVGWHAIHYAPGQTSCEINCGHRIHSFQQLIQDV